jgi:hypothetical protein
MLNPPTSRASFKTTTHNLIRVITHPLFLCEALLLLTLLLFDRPLIRGDAVAYFMWTASIGGDFDMDLQNQAERFGSLNTYMALYNPKTGRYGNAFAWGQGLIMQPAFWMARMLDRFEFMRINDEWFLSLQAYPLAYSLTAMMQVNLMTMATLAMAYDAARRVRLSRSAAAIGGLATVWGTPLYYYSTIQPVYSHATATFVHTLALYSVMRWLTSPRDHARWPVWLFTGLAFGLATLCRWQIAMSFAVVVVLLAFSRLWKPLGWCFIGFGAVVWHIPYTFTWMFGSPFVVPMESLENQPGFLGFHLYWAEVLFSGERGLFIWSPIALLGMLGLMKLERQYWPLAATLGSVVVAQVVINSAISGWNAGDSYGMRRLTEIYFALALGAAAWLSVAGRVATRSGLWRIVGWTGYGILIGAALYGFVLVVAHLVFGYFTDPAFGFVTTPPSSTAFNTLVFLFFSPPKIDLIWPMMEHHFGPWAWTWPGP